MDINITNLCYTLTEKELPARKEEYENRFTDNDDNIEVIDSMCVSIVNNSDDHTNPSDTKGSKLKLEPENTLEDQLQDVKDVEMENMNNETNKCKKIM